MKVIFMGTPDFAAASLEAVVNAGHEVAAVVTNVDKPAKRGKHIQFSDVKKKALELGLPVLQPARVKDEEFIRQLSAYEADIIIVAAYGHIIPKAILEMPKYGCINVHASLLPKYRGAAPIQWAVVDGEEKSGVTIMQMNEGLDTGDTIAVSEVILDEDETGGSLFDKLSDEGGRLLTDTLKKIEAGDIHPVPQPAESPTPYARMIRKTDGLVDWSKSAVEIERLVRGMNPWPSAFTYLGNKSLKLWKVRTDEAESGAEPGSVFDVNRKGFKVQTGKGSLQILELQLEGKKRLTAEEFLRGRAIEEKTVLGGVARG